MPQNFITPKKFTDFCETVYAHETTNHYNINLVNTRYYDISILALLLQLYLIKYMSVS
jgi:hypothetical protein